MSSFLGAGFNFNLKSGGLSVPTWVEYFDNTVWVADGPDNDGSWDAANNEWDSGHEPKDDNVIYLSPLGGWEVNFRPSKIRVTHSRGNDSDAFIYLRGTNGGIIVRQGASFGGTFYSGQEIDLTWSGFDILYLIMNITSGGEISWSVTNIEFLIG